MRRSMGAQRERNNIACVKRAISRMNGNPEQFKKERARKRDRERERGSRGEWKKEESNDVAI